MISMAAGNDAPGDDVAHRAGGVRHTGEVGQERLDLLREWKQPDPGLGQNSQGPFAPGEESRQVEPGALALRASQLHQVSLGGHHLRRQDVEDRGAIFEAVRASGVGADVAADGAGALAGRVGCEVETQWLDPFRELQIDDAGFHHGVTSLGIDLEDTVQMGELDQNSAADGNGAAAETGSGASRKVGNVVGVGEPNDLLDLSGRRRIDHEIGWPPVKDQGVTLVDHQFGGVELDLVLTHDGRQASSELLLVHGIPSSRNGFPHPFSWYSRENFSSR